MGHIKTNIHVLYLNEESSYFNNTLKVIHSKFLSVILCYHSLLRQNHFLPEAANLLDATERTVI